MPIIEERNEKDIDLRNKYGPVKTIINYLTVQKRLPKVFPQWAKLEPDEYFISGRVVMPDKRVRLVTSGCFLPFADHLEMNGRVSAHIISYKIDEENKLELFLHSSYPNFRLRPTATEGSFAHNFTDFSKVSIDGTPADERVRFVDVLGKLTFVNSSSSGVEIRRTFMPAVFTTALIEKIEVENLSESEKTVKITVPKGEYLSLPKYSEDNVSYLSRVDLADADGKMMSGLTEYDGDSVLPEETKVFYAVYYTRPQSEDILVDCKFEEKKRNEFINNILKGIRIETPEHILDAMFTHAVIRCSEAVFETKSGLMHCPGGGAYYGAIWTNDNVEYSAPFFGYSGLDTPIKAIINTLRLFQSEIDFVGKKGLKKSIPTSIMNCGDNVWALAGDRGDTQMYASGLTRFLLALGDRTLAEEFMHTVEYCIDYSKSKTDKKGRVKSTSDELEGRFPSGRYNLSTNCLAYDAYLNASFLSGALGLSQKKYEFFNLASKQRNAIIKNFSSVVEGYKTFKYYPTNKVLRSWISLPMCVGIRDNATDTFDALFSPAMYQEGRLKTASNRKTAWDRSLLFALKGGFKIGKCNETVEYLRDYTKNRLIGIHSPYPYEAFPEGNMRQLSAESALFARIFTEGMFGLQIIDFGKFSVTPSIPTDWNKVALRHIVLADMPVDIIIENNRLSVLDQTGKLIKECEVTNGQKTDINLFN